MSTGYSWEGIRQVRATLLGARHVGLPERLCGGYVYLGRYISVRPLPLPFTTPCKSNQVTHPKQHKSFFWDNVIERSHCTYNPLDVTPVK